MNKCMNVLLVITLLFVIFLSNGCGCYSCSPKTTGFKEISRDDECIHYEYYSYDSWYNREKCESCRIASLEFWLEVTVMNFPDAKWNKRPEAPPYKIISKELSESKTYIYTVRVKISDIMNSLEKAR